MTYKYIIVLGMHRSGTTAVAKFLQKNGIYMGPLKDNNAESRLFSFDLVFFLNYLGGIWDMPFYIERTYNISYKNAKWTFLNRVSKKLRIMKFFFRLFGFRLVGFKHPVASLLIEELKELENTFIVLCRRDAEEIVNSLEKRVTPRLNSVLGGQLPYGQFYEDKERMMSLVSFYHSYEDEHHDKVDFVINYEELVDAKKVEEIFVELGLLLGVKFRGAEKYFKRQG